MCKCPIFIPHHTTVHYNMRVLFCIFPFHFIFRLLLFLWLWFCVDGHHTHCLRNIQHYYPDGGWGWIICSVAFLAHILTTGFQLSYGLLSFYVIQHLGEHVASETGKAFVIINIYIHIYFNRVFIPWPHIVVCNNIMRYNGFHPLNRCDGVAVVQNNLLFVQ